MFNTKRFCYVENDREKIVQFICKQRAYMRLRSRSFWVELQNSKILPRTWQSMKEHFKSHIIHNIDEYNISHKEKNLIKEGWIKSKRFKNNTNNVPVVENKDSKINKNKRKILEILKYQYNNSQGNTVNNNNEDYTKLIDDTKKLDISLVKYFRQNKRFLQIRHELSIYIHFLKENPTSIAPNVLRERFLNLIYPNIHRYGLSFLEIVTFYGNSHSDIFNTISFDNLETKCVHDINGTLGYIFERIIVENIPYLLITNLSDNDLPTPDALSSIYDVNVKNIYYLDLESFCLFHFISDLSLFIIMLKNNEIEFIFNCKSNELNSEASTCELDNISIQNTTHSSVCLSTSPSTLDDTLEIRYSQEIEVQKTIVSTQNKLDIIYISSDED